MLRPGVIEPASERASKHVSIKPAAELAAATSGLATAARAEQGINFEQLHEPSEEAGLGFACGDESGVVIADERLPISCWISSTRVWACVALRDAERQLTARAVGASLRAVAAGARQSLGGHTSSPADGAEAAHAGQLVGMSHCKGGRSALDLAPPVTASSSTAIPSPNPNGSSPTGSNFGAKGSALLRVRIIARLHAA